MLTELRYPDRQSALDAKQAITTLDIRILDAKIRPALPDFKGHKQRKISLWVNTNSDRDQMELIKWYRSVTHAA